ncbi:toxin-activating lysine-acyltransferase [Photobacterium phosphoreum]|uniref:toxin-activating lysine-acyltransferase n=1 Tax=Photobacterium phosphoreum TaxID=659 RepID=UPI000D167448|nr:toxin-activating lysine-acyltransferase [Photobacterium phosphoreum]PSU70628.1 toxin-activating lysine-acyltransferase [Photobacterium phosphoreum]
MPCYDNERKSPISIMNALFAGKEQKGLTKNEIFQELGQFLEILVKDKELQNITLGSFLHWIKPAVLHEQYIFIKNDGDIEPSGYLIWAWVDTETLFDFFNKERFILHPMSFNDGKNLIILDFYCADKANIYSVIRKLYRKARYEVGVHYKNINISIRDGNGLVVRNNKMGCL